MAAAARILGNAAEAEEAAADALLRAYASLRDFRGEASFGTWAHRIACRVAIDRLRRRRARARRETLCACDRPVARGPAGPLADADRVAAVRRAVDRLSAVQRIVVALHAWEGLSYHAIAETLRCSYDAVRVNRAHARKTLRRLLRLDEEDRW